jgi:hypothetical protein
VTVEVRPTLNVTKIHAPKIVQGGKTTIWLNDLAPSPDLGLSLNLGDGMGLYHKFPMTSFGIWREEESFADDRENRLRGRRVSGSEGLKNPVPFLPGICAAHGHVAFF